MNSYRYNTMISIIRRHFFALFTFFWRYNLQRQPHKPSLKKLINFNSDFIPITPLQREDARWRYINRQTKFIQESNIINPFSRSKRIVCYNFNNLFVVAQDLKWRATAGVEFEKIILHSTSIVEMDISIANKCNRIK